MAAGSSFIVGRAFIEQVNFTKVSATMDFPDGKYFAQFNQYTALNKFQSESLDTGTVTLNTGQTADLATTGGANAAAIYIDSLESAFKATDGLASLGLKNENKMWSLQN